VPPVLVNVPDVSENVALPKRVMVTVVDDATVAAHVNVAFPTELIYVAPTVTDAELIVNV
jgi:hypothetical protein